jgi:hypothetical protein
LKDLQSDGKQGSLSKQARHLSRNRLEDIVASGMMSTGYRFFTPLVNISLR